MIRRQFLQMALGGVGLAAVDTVSGLVPTTPAPDRALLRGSFSSVVPPFLRQDIETFFIASISGRMGRPIGIQTVDERSSQPGALTNFNINTSTLSTLPLTANLSRDGALARFLTSEEAPMTNLRGDILLPLAVGSNQFLSAIQVSSLDSIPSDQVFQHATRVNNDIHQDVASLKNGQIAATAFFSPLSWTQTLPAHVNNLGFLVAPNVLPVPVLLAVWDKESWQSLQRHHAMIHWWARYTLYVSSDGWQRRQMDALASLRSRYPLYRIDTGNPSSAEILT